MVIGNKTSGQCRVTSGAPQGSILGPTLFILFLNDISSDLSPGRNIAMYADDTKIWRRVINQDDHWILQRDINSLMNWASSNKMKFHPSKESCSYNYKRNYTLLGIITAGLLTSGENVVR